MDDNIEPRHILWHNLNNAITELQRHLTNNNVIQAYFQWQAIYHYAALLKNTEAEPEPDQHRGFNFCCQFCLMGYSNMPVEFKHCPNCGEKPYVKIGSVPHPDPDNCPDECDSKHAHDMMRHQMEQQKESMKGSARIKDLDCSTPDENLTAEGVQRKHEREAAGLPEDHRTVVVDSSYGKNQTGCESNPKPPYPLNCPKCGRFFEWMHEHKCGPMTLERAVEVLNKWNYDECHNWSIGEFNLCARGKGRLVHSYEAIAIAEKLEREK